MTSPQPRNPLHGVTLEMMIRLLVTHYGWEELGRAIPVRCFQVDPSMGSSLKFLRRTPWARDRVEQLYLRTRFLPGPAPQCFRGDQVVMPAQRSGATAARSFSACLMASTKCSSTVMAAL